MVTHGGAAHHTSPHDGASLLTCSRTCGAPGVYFLGAFFFWMAETSGAEVGHRVRSVMNLSALRMPASQCVWSSRSPCTWVPEFQPFERLEVLAICPAM